MSHRHLSPARIRLRVSPGAARSAVVGRHGAGWKIRVAAPAEDGRANAEVVRLLAAALDVGERDVAIASGTRSRDKTLVVEGLTAAEVDARLATAAAR
ncbi:MAG TPA: DUF167 domain-containing protein [Gaiellaceae bacterium]